MKSLKIYFIIWFGICCFSHPHAGWILLLLAILLNIHFVRRLTELEKPTYEEKLKSYINGFKQENQC